MEKSSPKPKIQEAVLSRLQAFAGLDGEDVRGLIRYSSAESFRAGDRIIQEGEEGHCMYVVLEGSVRVVAAGVDLAVLGDGDFFGEISLVDDGPRSADVLAVSDCQLLLVTRMTLGLLTASHPAAAIHLLAAIGRSLVGKLRQDNLRLAELMLLGRGGGASSK